MRAIEHFKTITHHRHLVRQYCFRLGLYYQGLTHDLSKYSPSEFWRGVKYYQGYRSPNDAERRENGVSLAWLHHKGRNRHHFEYWIDYCIGDDGKVYMGGCKMPLKYVAEMFCDRIAACKVYQGDKYTDGLRLLRKVARPYPHPSRDRRAHRQDAARTQGAGRGRGVRLCARSSARGKAMSDKMRKLSEDRLQSCIFQSKLFSL